MPRKSTKTTRKRPRKGDEGAAEAGPPADFSLAPHPSGRWCRRIRGKHHYFSPLDAPGVSKDDLLAGRKPRAKDDARLDVGALVNAYIQAAAQRLEAGELNQATFDYSRAAGSEIVSEIGRHRATEDLRPADCGGLRVRFAKRFGPTEVGKRIQVVRSAFKYRR